MDASLIFDDDNSKDFYRRQTAFLQNQGIIQQKTVDDGDASFKLRKLNHRDHYNKKQNDKCC